MRRGTRPFLCSWPFLRPARDDTGMERSGRFAVGFPILLAEYLVALAISPQPCQGGVGI